MASEKQLAANKKNAALSTGPKTAAGKARSARNAWKHGLYAGLALPDERDEDFRRLQRAFLAHYQPQNPVDYEQVVQLAALMSRLRRYPKMETEILASHGFIPNPDNREEFYFAGSGWAFVNDGSKTRSAPVLAMIEDRCARRALALKKDLDKRLLASAAVEPGAVKPAESAPGLGPEQPQAAV